MPKILIENWGDLLMCNVSGNPVPRLIWYIDGEFIKENKNEETSLTVKKGPGYYKCFASNVFGNTSFAVHLSASK